MTKREFLDELKVALASRVSASEATEHLYFYEDYINTQIRMGRSEEEILVELGEPRLLARNIAESKKYASDNGEKKQDYNSDNRQDRRNGNEYSDHNKIKSVKIPGWLLVILIILIIIIFIALCFSLLSFLAPVLIPLSLVLFLIRFLQKKG